MLCLPSHPKSNTKGCKAFPNAFPSLLFSQQLWWTKAFGWEQAHDRSSNSATLSLSSSPFLSASNLYACSSLNFWWLDVFERASSASLAWSWWAILSASWIQWTNRRACVKKAPVCHFLGARECCSLPWYSREDVGYWCNPPRRHLVLLHAQSLRKKKKCIGKHHESRAWWKQCACNLARQAGGIGVQHLCSTFSWPREGKLHSYCHTLFKVRGDLAAEAPSSHPH